MKILLTHGYFLTADEREQRVMKPYPPLGLQYISAYLEREGWSNDIFDTTFATPHQLQSYLVDRTPDLIGIYTNLMTKIKVLEIIRFIRSEYSLRNTKIVLGGPEVRNHGEEFLRFGADVVVMGEGEATMSELAGYFAGLHQGCLTDIAGIAFLDEQGALQKTGERPLMKDLDQLPFPNRQKINQQQYFEAWKKRHGQSMVTINTMRGCPYGCRWCSRAVYGQSYRRRSPANVVEEIVQLRAMYTFDGIWFVDDVFTINHRWLRGFAAEIARRGLKVPYEVITRADRMNEEVVGLLKESGCFRVWIGAESGSQKILDAMNRMVKVEKVAEMIKLTKKYGIETGTFIMLGYPGETEADIIATRNYLLDADPDHYTVTIAYPIKGTPLYEEVEHRFTKNLAWETTTDRDKDFQRTYPRKYYDHAINWINQEISSHRLQKENRWSPRILTRRARALKSRIAMVLHRSVINSKPAQ